MSEQLFVTMVWHAELGDVWMVWDHERNMPADGFYYVPDIADAVTEAANRLLAGGRDPYHEWSWDDGRGRKLALVMTGIAAEIDRQVDATLNVLVRDGLVECRVREDTGELEFRLTEAGHRAANQREV